MGFRRRATRVQHDSTLHSTTMLHAGAPALGNSGPFRHNLSVLPWSWAAKPWLGSSYRMRCGCSRQGCCSGRAGRCRSECSGRRFDHPSANPGRGSGIRTGGYRLLMAGRTNAAHLPSTTPRLKLYQVVRRRRRLVGTPQESLYTKFSDADT